MCEDGDTTMLITPGASKSKSEPVVLNIPESNETGGSSESPPLIPEYRKFALSCVIFNLSLITTSLTAVVVHERLPNPKRYPPLPDIIKDKTERIPEAFQLAEYIIVALLSIFILMTIFHSHRFIILRRYCVIAAGLYYLRCITTLVTSLPNPNSHSLCGVGSVLSTSERLQKAFYIWIAGGMSVSGTYTCGDYLYSGHTITLTLLALFINEYTPRGMKGLHATTWTFGLTAMICIVCSYEHYTVDVVVALALSFLWFYCYHLICMQIATHTKPPKISVFFWPVYYMEHNTQQIVPNVYACPRFWEAFRNWGVTDRRATLQAINSRMCALFRRFTKLADS